MITVTRVFDFCYGHHLPDYEGKCSGFHGHNSRVEVELTDPRSYDTYPGMVVDFGDIKIEVGKILKELDHKDINQVLDNLYQPPTTENITLWLVDRIQRTPLGAGLVRVRVTETPTSWAEWKKEGAQCPTD